MLCFTPTEDSIQEKSSSRLPLTKWNSLLEVSNVFECKDLYFSTILEFVLAISPLPVVSPPFLICFASRISFQISTEDSYSPCVFTNIYCLHIFSLSVRCILSDLVPLHTALFAVLCAWTHWWWYYWNSSYFISTRFLGLLHLFFSRIYFLYFPFLL